MIGRSLSHYQILEKIGEGGMGEVFLAEDSSLHRKVALKFLPPEMQQDAAAHKRFVREARSAAALDHPYICSIHEVGESEGKGFIVMEYGAGKARYTEMPLMNTTPEISEKVKVVAVDVATGKRNVVKNLAEILP